MARGTDWVIELSDGSFVANYHGHSTVGSADHAWGWHYKSGAATELPKIEKRLGLNGTVRRRAVPRHPPAARVFKQWVKKLVGKSAYIRDISCAPQQVGAVVIVGPSRRGPEWCVVEEAPAAGFSNPREWTAMTIELSKLEIRA